MNDMPSAVLLHVSVLIVLTTIVIILYMRYMADPNNMVIGTILQWAILEIYVRYVHILKEGRMISKGQSTS